MSKPMTDEELTAAREEAVRIEADGSWFSSILGGELVEVIDEVIRLREQHRIDEEMIRSLSETNAAAGKRVLVLETNLHQYTKIHLG